MRSRSLPVWGMLSCGVRTRGTGTGLGRFKTGICILLLLGIRSEAEEPVFLREAVGPVLLRDLRARVVLAVAPAQALQLPERRLPLRRVARAVARDQLPHQVRPLQHDAATRRLRRRVAEVFQESRARQDRKSTRLNSSHLVISYAVFCLKKKKKKKTK